MFLKTSIIFSQTVPEASSGFDWPLIGYFSNNGGYEFLDWANYPSGSVFHPAEDWNQPGISGGCSSGCNSDKCLDVVAAAIGKVVYTNPASWGGIVIEHNYQGET